jgi:PucR C-terminal helix-turn-helix domain
LSSAATLPEVLATRSASVTEAVSAAVAFQVIPSSAWLMSEHQRGEREAIRKGRVERLLGLAAAGQPFSDDDLRFYEGLGAVFARHSVPLRLLTAAFDVGTTVITRESWRIAEARDFTEMARFTDAAARMKEQAQKASVAAYLEVVRSAGGLQPIRWMLAEALIAGGPVAAAAQAAGHRLAPGYLVMACSTAAQAYSDVLHGPAVAKAIESIPGTLYCRDRSRLIVLFPVEANQRQAADAARGLADRLPVLTGQPVLATQAYRPGLAAMPASLDEAHSTLSLVAAIPDADRRLYRADDLLVELAISRQPDIRQRLSALLAPLDAGADLRHTLQTLLACRLDRERTARELRIHRRTLRYRIDRIRDLSGIDPDSVMGLALLRAALTATLLPEPAPSPDEEETAAVAVPTPRQQD